jgi:hypothetical protein
MVQFLGPARTLGCPELRLRLVLYQLRYARCCSASDAVDVGSIARVIERMISRFLDLTRGFRWSIKSKIGDADDIRQVIP